MKTTHDHSPSAVFFRRITAHPKLWLSIGLLTIIALGAFIPTLETDPTAESFLPDDHAARIYRDKVEDIFGLTDPMVIAVKNDDIHGVFTPKTLQLVQWITDEVSQMSAIKAYRVVSLATEDDIIGTPEGMEVEPFIDGTISTQAQADTVREKVMDFPLYLGSLVSRDASTTLIVTEVTDESLAPQVYEDLLALVERAPTQDNETLHVAGDGAVSGYLVTYINADSARLVPLSVIIITLLCMLSFRTFQGVALPGLVISAATTSAMGVMAILGDPVYVITTSMPILLVGVAVADSIHILSEYYEELASKPKADQQTLVVNAMGKMWRPVLLTTVTSMIGFLGIYASSYMPPMQSFGLYSMVGLGMAGVYSLIILPASQMLFTPKVSPAFEHSGDRFSGFMNTLGKGVLGNSKSVLATAALVCIGGIYSAMNLEVNEAWVDNFQKSDAIYQANEAINATMDGTNNLDIVIETPNDEDLFKPENLRKIEALQRFVETLPNVGGTTSIVDYIKQMNRAVSEDDKAAYTLPNDANLISQYFLLYSASGDPTDFEEEIDYDYRLALVRARVSTGLFQQNKQVIQSLQAYLEHHFNSPEISASLSGRVNVDYEWLENLLGEHYKGVVLALLLVLLVATVAFRSFYGGLLALIPVLLATLSVYAFMGLSGITLAVGTTMTSAIALGIGVDFAIHTLDRFKLLIKEKGVDPDEALQMIFPSTGRALLFNFFAVFIGFGLLGFSYVPPLANLGILIAFAVLVSFVSSMTVLPALVKHLRPAFLGFTPNTPTTAYSLHPQTQI